MLFTIPVRVSDNSSEGVSMKIFPSPCPKSVHLGFKSFTTPQNEKMSHHSNIWSGLAFCALTNVLNMT